MKVKIEETGEIEELEIELHELACKFAERALRRERKSGREPHPDSWKAIKVKRQWMKNKATDEELAAACAAAWAAEWDAEWDAARAAGKTAECAAAWAAEKKWQLKHIKVIKEI